MKRTRRGRFIVLEGLDGAGTTTQSQRLAAWLRGRGRRAHVTAEPSGGPVGALVRQILSRRISGGSGAAQGFDSGALALLFAADRLDHLSAEIGPRLAEGLDVVCDRFTLSSLAYQSITSGDMGWVESVNARAAAPDVTLFLEVSPRTAIRRRFAASGGSREIFEEPAFQRRVARAYGQAIARVRRLGQRVEVVDGERSPEDVAALLANAIEDLLR